MYNRDCVTNAIENVEDILLDSLEILGTERVEDPGCIQYGDLVLTIAPKEGKANTLLADHLFSPALLLAERIERGLVEVAGRSIIELGAGCALPSLLAATLSEPPRLVVVTDYPDDVILGNLRSTVERNKKHFRPPCVVRCQGYEWGKDASSLLHLSENPDGSRGYDVVIMSDLLHFHSSHNALIHSLSSLLVKTPRARVYVAAGTYTPRAVRQNFLDMGSRIGLVWESDSGTSGQGNEDEDKEDIEAASLWLGTRVIAGIDATQLGVRKGMCRWWVGRWHFPDIKGAVDGITVV